MQFSVLKGDVWAAAVEVIAVPVFEGDELRRVFLQLPEAFRLKAEAVAKKQEFTGKRGQQIVVHGDAYHVLLFGLGTAKRGEAFLEVVRDSAGQLAQLAERFGYNSLAIKANWTAEAVEQFVLAAELAAYRYHEFKKEPKPAKLTTVMFAVADAPTARAVAKACDKAKVVSEGVNLARTLVNTPAQSMAPARLAEVALEVAKNSGGTVTAKILEREDCAKLGMGAFLAVAQGAEHAPKFIHLTYTSPRPTKKTLGIAGKGVTFDSGGLSLKPADSMMTMKCDMAGAATVIGFFSTLATLKPRVNIHGVIAATENMPSGKAIRPGDIVKASNGSTIEILNTDAEGRLTLADALHYLVQLKPDALIDLATLTGACVVALGEEITGLMTNDRKLGAGLLAAAKEAGEKMWELPLEPRYRDFLLSEVADYKNIASTRYGGTLTAGLFLQEFVSGLPWAHLDIAGPAFAERPMASYLGKGGTGYGVRTLVEFIETF